MDNTIGPFFFVRTASGETMVNAKALATVRGLSSGTCMVFIDGSVLDSIDAYTEVKKRIEFVFRSVR